MEYLAVSQLIVDSGLLVLIWLVQLIIYPSFRYVADQYFAAWHARYTSLIALVAGPMMLAQVGIELMHIVSQNLRWLRIGIIAAIWISTFGLSVPCHKRLHSGRKKRVSVERLIKSNWIRTILWSILFLETIRHAYW